MKLYNGCPDDELAALWKARDAAHKFATDHNWQITYFPGEEKYTLSFRGDSHRTSLGGWFGSPMSAAVYLREWLERNKPAKPKSHPRMRVTRSAVLSVPCVWCGAGIDEPCVKLKTGWPRTSFHVDRWRLAENPQGALKLLSKKLRNRRTK